MGVIIVESDDNVNMILGVEANYRFSQERINLSRLRLRESEQVPRIGIELQGERSAEAEATYLLDVSGSAEAMRRHDSILSTRLLMCLRPRS